MHEGQESTAIGNALMGTGGSMVASGREENLGEHMVPRGWGGGKPRGGNEKNQLVGAYKGLLATTTCHY